MESFIDKRESQNDAICENFYLLYGKANYVDSKIEQSIETLESTKKEWQIFDRELNLLPITTECANDVMFHICTIDHSYPLDSLTEKMAKIEQSLHRIEYLRKQQAHLLDVNQREMKFAEWKNDKLLVTFNVHFLEWIFSKSPQTT